MKFCSWNLLYIQKKLTRTHTHKFYLLFYAECKRSIVSRSQSLISFEIYLFKIGKSIISHYIYKISVIFSLYIFCYKMFMCFPCWQHISARTFFFRTTILLRLVTSENNETRFCYFSLFTLFSFNQNCHKSEDFYQDLWLGMQNVQYVNHYCMVYGNAINICF